MTLNRRYGVVGLLAMPYFWVVEALSPIVEFLGYIYVVIAYFGGFLAVDIVLLLLLLAMMYGVLISQTAMGVEALLVYRYSRLSERLIMVLMSLFELAGYRQILLWERLTASMQIRRKRGQWGKFSEPVFLRMH